MTSRQYDLVAPPRRRSCAQRKPTLALLCACLAWGVQVASASDPGQDAQALRAELSALRAQQARIVELQRETDAGIRRLEALLGVQAPATAAATETMAPATPPEATPVPAAAIVAGPPASRLELSGDVRLRHERNFSEGDGPSRNREAMRARIAAEYALDDDLAIGARLVTGNLDDPRSAGVTLSNFNDDFDVGLDRLYARYNVGDVTLWGGKFANPFRSSSLVWDNDVNPQGAAADYGKRLDGGGRLHATAMYFAVDERSAGEDSHMLGAQLGFEPGGDGPWRGEAYLAYYHYVLDSVAGADSTDFRTNLRGPDGDYLSQFHLANAIVGTTYAGFGEAWPLRMTGEYVRNLGAATDADSGYSVDAVLGRASKPGDSRLRYGFQVAETDAVLAAFSHDDTTLATNYRQHTLAIDYVLRADTVLNFTWYRFRPDNPVDTPTFDPDAWLNRMRFNLLFRF